MFQKCNWPVFLRFLHLIPNKFRFGELSGLGPTCIGKFIFAWDCLHTWTFSLNSHSPLGNPVFKNWMHHFHRQVYTADAASFIDGLIWHIIHAVKLQQMVDFLDHMCIQSGIVYQSIQTMMWCFYLPVAKLNVEIGKRSSFASKCSEQYINHSVSSFDQN